MTLRLLVDNPDRHRESTLMYETHQAGEELLLANKKRDKAVYALHTQQIKEEMIN